jgi:two-component system chemotaxis response regulator CheY
VDDSRAMRMIVRRAIRQAGFDAEVIEASNGAEGLDAVREHAPNVVLSDWNMPEMNGLEFLKALRASGSQVAFGFVTSETTLGMVDMAYEAGALFLVSKPFTPTDLSDALGKVPV